VQVVKFFILTAVLIFRKWWHLLWCTCSSSALCTKHLC